MALKKEDKKLSKDQAEKNYEFKKDLFNIRFKKINNQIQNPSEYNQIKKYAQIIQQLKTQNDKKNIKRNCY